MGSNRGILTYVLVLHRYCTVVSRVWNGSTRVDRGGDSKWNKPLALTGV